jgi:hypothetical protein
MLTRKSKIVRGNGFVLLKPKNRIFRIDESSLFGISPLPPKTFEKLIKDFEGSSAGYGDTLKG